MQNIILYLIFNLNKFKIDIMMLKIKVIPNSKINAIEKISQDNYKIKIMEKAIDGKANKAVISALAEYFNTKKSNINIVKGAMSSKKIIEIIV